MALDAQTRDSVLSIADLILRDHVANAQLAVDLTSTRYADLEAELACAKGELEHALKYHSELVESLGERREQILHAAELAIQKQEGAS